jgi:predicted esterase
MKLKTTKTSQRAALLLGPLLIAACGGTPSPGDSTGVTAGSGTSTPAQMGAAGAAAGAKAPAQPTGPTAGSAGSGLQTAQAGKPGMTTGMMTAAAGQPSAAGAGGAAMMTAAAGTAAPTDPMMEPGTTNEQPGTPTTGPGPKIPEVMGDCPEFKNGTIMIGGHSNVMITAGEPGKMGPILFYWHGTGSSAEGEIGRIPRSVIDDIVSSGGIIAGFNGGGSARGKGDCSGTAAHNMADFDAADQLVACAVTKHGSDPRRIYSAGCSAGGLQSGCMAMMRSSYLAAVAPNSGGIVTPQPWQDDHSPAVMTMHGGAGDMVIVTFSQTSNAFDMQAKTHGSFVVNCDHGGGHCAASDELKSAYWQFLKDHPFGFEKSPWETAFPAGVPDYCKIF